MRASGFEFVVRAAPSDADAVKMAADGSVDIAETDVAGVLEWYARARVCVGAF